MTNVHALEPQLLEAIVARDNLQRAWRRVKANKGAAGNDAISVTDFPAWGAAILADHQSQLDER